MEYVVSLSVHKIKITWSNFSDWTEGKNANVPEDPGVYEFYIGLKGGGKRRIYIGKAENLKAIYLAHLGDDEPNECLKSHLKKHVWYYRYAIIKNTADREDAELGLFRTHSYECNKIEPPGSGRESFVINEDP